MLLIVMHHYVVNSGLTDPDGVIYANPTPLCWRSLFLLVCGAWGKIGIDCFVFITGYYMCCSQITTRKFVKLVGAWLLYRWIFYAIFLCSSYEPFGLKTLVKALVPITSISKGFVSCYVVFFLFIPFLNVLIRNISEKQHIRLVLLCCFTYVLVGSIPKFRVTMNYVSWFVVLYFVSSYVRLYPKRIFDDARFWTFCMLITLALSAVSVLGMCWLGNLLRGRIIQPFFFVVDSNKFMALITAFSAFMCFKNLKIKRSSLINAVAASTFGVLLIHANSGTMRRWLWRDTLDVVGHYASPYMPLHIFGSVVGVFVVCVLIDQIRIILIEKPFFRFWDAHWDDMKARWERIDAKIWAKLGCEFRSQP